MKSNPLVLTMMTACSVLFVGCSNGSDDKGSVSAPSSDYQGLWTEKTNLEAWESFKSGTQTAEEACVVYKGFDEETQTEYTNLSTLVWIDGNEYNSCDWSEDWRSSCEVQGQISGNVLTGPNDDGQESKMTLNKIDAANFEFVSLRVGEKTYSQEEMAKDLGSELLPLTKITEEQAAELYDFMKETCGVNVGVADQVSNDEEIIQSFDPKLDGRPKKSN